MIVKAYRMRFGHRMYDIETPGGQISTYYAHDQIEVIG